jgi:hypothetical protein
MPREMSLLSLRLKLRSRLTGAKERLALRATLTAAHLLGLATGKHLGTFGPARTRSSACNPASNRLSSTPAWPGRSSRSSPPASRRSRSGDGLTTAPPFASESSVGSTVKPVPPVTRFCDRVRSLLQLMMRLGVGGEDLVAATLARAGWRLAPRSVRRIAHPAPLPTLPEIPRKPPRPVIARFAHHIWIWT